MVAGNRRSTATLARLAFRLAVALFSHWPAGRRHQAERREFSVFSSGSGASGWLAHQERRRWALVSIAGTKARC